MHYKPKLSETTTSKGHNQAMTKRSWYQGKKKQFALSLRNINWRPQYNMKTCKVKFHKFHSKMQNLIEAHYHMTTIDVNTKDMPCISNVFKTLVQQRAQASKD